MKKEYLVLERFVIFFSAASIAEKKSISLSLPLYCTVPYRCNMGEKRNVGRLILYCVEKNTLTCTLRFFSMRLQEFWHFSDCSSRHNNTSLYYNYCLTMKGDVIMYFRQIRNHTTKYTKFWPGLYCKWCSNPQYYPLEWNVLLLFDTLTCLDIPYIKTFSNFHSQTWLDHQILPLFALLLLTADTVAVLLADSMIQ